MDSTRNYDAWIGHDVYDADGDKVGEIDDIFYDDVTQRPEWLAVKTGLFGSKRTFVPIQGSSRYGDEDLQVGFTKDFIKEAPGIDPEGSLTSDEEQMLWTHYGYDYDARTKNVQYGYGKSHGTNRIDKDYDARWSEQRGERRGEVVAEATATNETVTKQAQPETVRLRKYQWTEQVPVQREEVRVEGESRGQTQTRSRNA